MNRKIYTNWTKDKCAELALPCTTRTQFNARHRAAYHAARINGWLDDICSHMGRKRSEKLGWSKSDYHAETLRYQTRKDHRINHPSHHVTIYTKGWADELFAHMDRLENYSEKHSC